jgi:hypothetical protein
MIASSQTWRACIADRIWPATVPKCLQSLSVNHFECRDPLRHAHSSPIHDQLMGFMLASDTTMQIHFIDIIATADVESDALLLDAGACNAVMMDIGNVTAWRNHQP